MKRTIAEIDHDIAERTEALVSCQANGTLADHFGRLWDELERLWAERFDAADRAAA